MTAKTKLQKWGNSHGVRLPKSLLDQLELEDLDSGINFEITVKENSIILTPVKKESSFLENLFINYNFNDLPEEIDWGEQSVGDEVF